MESKINSEKGVALFESASVRRVWINEEEKWYFSVVDVIKILTESTNPQVYWRVFKKRLSDEGSNETVTKCNGLKMIAEDGKIRITDAADTETLLRLIQSIPSPKAEPFKRWLAKVGYERLEEIQNPELAMDRMKSIYEKKGYSKEWIDKRSRGIAVRHSLTDEWRDRGVKNSLGYAILTNEIMKSAFGLKVEDYKKVKGLQRENLRDHMEDMELILTMDGGGVAKRTREDIEKISGTKVISQNNFLNLNNNDDKINLN